MVMACLQLSRPGVSPVLGVRPVIRRRGSSGLGGGVLPLRCCLREDKTSSSGEEERPESMFSKELKRRGMTPTPPTKESASTRGMYPGVSEEVGVEEELDGGSGGRGSTKRNGVASVEYEKDLANQRERSMALNSEGLGVRQPSPLMFA
ncbi:hypothetical protein Taro_040700 [Colocasia esculenta]|uniref:Uncharacterized protein n=1 Tax=Colocasia esculenta TaxID=4460 RepID=A0A843W9M2_COLES|nr:hypothetical protein [Colocasia esculenta]